MRGAGLLLLAIFALPGCEPLLRADFDAMPVGALPEGPVDLPGAPAGDRIIVANFAQVAASGGGTNRSLFVHRSASLGHAEVYFDPIAASGERPIFFSWRGEIAGGESPGSGAPLVAVKLRNLAGPDQPNLISRLIVRLGPQRISVQTLGFVETNIGFGVTGPHNATLRVDPSGGYAFNIRGDGVSPGGGFTHTGSLAPGSEIDPANVGITITFDEALDAGGSIYIVDDVLVSDRIGG